MLPKVLFTYFLFKDIIWVNFHGWQSPRSESEAANIGINATEYISLIYLFDLYVTFSLSVAYNYSPSTFTLTTTLWGRLGWEGMIWLAQSHPLNFVADWGFDPTTPGPEY